MLCGLMFGFGIGSATASNTSIVVKRKVIQLHTPRVPHTTLKPHSKHTEPTSPFCLVARIQRNPQKLPSKSKTSPHPRKSVVCVCCPVLCVCCPVLCVCFLSYWHFPYCIREFRGRMRVFSVSVWLVFGWVALCGRLHSLFAPLSLCCILFSSIVFLTAFS